MRTHKWYFSMILTLVILLAGSSGLSCTCSQSTVGTTPQASAVQSKNTATAKASAVPQQTSEKGDPDWWKKQPDLKNEEMAIQAVIDSFKTALAAKDVKLAASYFSPDSRDKYSQVLAMSPDLLPQMAKDMEKATLSFLSLDTDFDLSRIAEYQFKVDGNTFSMVFIKIDGKWMLESY